MSPKAFSLANYVPILQLHEADYRAAKKGNSRDAVLDVIMGDITSDEDCKFKGSVKVLKQASLKFHQ